MYRRRRRRRRRWHPAVIVVIVVALQAIGIATVQGTEAGWQLLGIFAPKQEVSVPEESGELFEGFPSLYKVSAPAEEKVEYPDLRDQYPIEALRDFEQLKKLYLYDPDYVVPSPELLDADTFMGWDLSMDFDVEGPQILIFHTHGSEYYADTGPGGVIQVGEYLKELLESKYGVRVLHDTNIYDQDAEINAYDKMRESVQAILDENPSIQVTIDLHRDGIGGDGRLVTSIDGREVAQLMFVTGISAEYNWETGMMEEMSYLYNPNRLANLSFSFRTKMAADVMYPGLMRNLYLSTYRYSTYMREKGLLLEVGAEGNTLEECCGSMDYFAPVLMQILMGKG